MSWSFECSECGNSDFHLFTKYKPVERSLTCIVCKTDLKHLSCGMTEKKEQKQETKEDK